MKDLIYVLAGLLEFVVMIFVLFLGYKGLQFIFSKDANSEHISKDEQQKYKKYTIISIISMVILLTIKYLTV